MNRQQIRGKVKAVLKKTDQKVPIDVLQIAEDSGAEVRLVPFQNEVAGMLLREEGRAIIGVNKDHPQVRQRFTIAHELGHFFLHDDQEVYVDRGFAVRMRDGKSSLAVDIHEIEANAFAAELLMPTSMLLNDVRGLTIDYEDGGADIKHLADRYEVSVQAMTLRLTNLGVIETQV